MLGAACHFYLLQDEIVADPWFAVDEEILVATALITRCGDGEVPCSV